MKKFFQAFIALSLMLCMTFSAVVPSFAAQPKTYYVTASPYLNIRSGAGTNYRTVGSYKKDAKVTVTATKSGWSKTSKGWVSTKYLSTKKPTTATSKTYYVTASPYLNIRSGAGTSYRKVGEYKEGAKVTTTTVKNDWAKTSKGWISMDYLSSKKPLDDSDDLVKTVAGVRVTAYCAGRCCNGSWSSGDSTTTASGVRLRNSESYADQYCAATPAVGKLGQYVKMTIKGKSYDLKIVDRLGSSSGKKVDLFVPSHSETKKFGVSTGVTGKIYE